MRSSFAGAEPWLKPASHWSGLHARMCALCGDWARIVFVGAQLLEDAGFGTGRQRQRNPLRSPTRQPLIKAQGRYSGGCRPGAAE